MRRIQVYLDDDLWTALHARAQAQKTTISELVREAIRERYMEDLDRRAKAMQAIIGIRKNRRFKLSAVEEVRELRRGRRLDALLERPEE